MRSFTVAERRDRLARRHLLIGEGRPTVAEIASRLVGLHATDPASVYLSAFARSPSLTPADVDTALYEHLTAVKHLGMRRTVFVLAANDVPMVQAACTDRVAAGLRKRLVRDVEDGGAAPNGARFLAAAEREVLEALAASGPTSGAALSRALPVLQTKLRYADGKAWGGDVAVASRILGQLAAEGRIVRGRPTGSWTSSQHRWMLAPSTGEPPLTADDARDALVRAWLRTYGPATTADVAWWSGLPIGTIRAALERISATAVTIDDGPAWVIAGDVEPEPPVGPWVALLPSLDPTVMGWQSRDWYLGEHRAALFDRNGNAGPTVWCDGRIVGGWAQRRTGEVVWKLLDDIGRDATALVEQRAAELQRWLGSVVVSARFPAPLGTQLRA